MTKRFLYVGSMQGDVPVMFEIVAVGAIARTLLLRRQPAMLLLQTVKLPRPFANALPLEN